MFPVGLNNEIRFFYRVQMNEKMESLPIKFEFEMFEFDFRIINKLFAIASDPG